MESSSTAPTLAKKIIRILRAICCIIRKGIISKRKLIVDVLLLKRGKIAGKDSPHSSFSCNSMDPAQSFYNPRHVEFSCSNTPFHLNKRKYRKHDFAAIAKAFEMLNSRAFAGGNDAFSDAESIAPSVAPSPMMVGFGMSPMVVRRVRITDSPFPMKEEGVANDGKVDEEAEEFIQRFYEQLKIQQKTAVWTRTPEYKFRRG